MSPECTADIGRIVATLISVIELKTFVGKYRPLKLVFSSSSLGITLLLNSGHCFRDYVSWKYLSWRVSFQTCAHQTPEVGSDSGKSPSCLCLSFSTDIYYWGGLVYHMLYLLLPEIYSPAVLPTPKSPCPGWWGHQGFQGHKCAAEAGFYMLALQSLSTIPLTLKTVLGSVPRSPNIETE